MKVTKINLQEYLKKYFGFSKFKGLQKDAIESLIEGNDTFVVMPDRRRKIIDLSVAGVDFGWNSHCCLAIDCTHEEPSGCHSAGISSEYGIAHVLNSSLNKGEVARVKSDIGKWCH